MNFFVRMFGFYRVQFLFPDHSSEEKIEIRSTLTKMKTRAIGEGFWWPEQLNKFTSLLQLRIKKYFVFQHFGIPLQNNLFLSSYLYRLFLWNTHINVVLQLQ